MKEKSYFCWDCLFTRNYLKVNFRKTFALSRNWEQIRYFFNLISSIYIIANSPAVSTDMLAAYLTELGEPLSENSRRADVLLDEFYIAGRLSMPFLCP